MGGTGGGWSWLWLLWAELSKTLIHLTADGWVWIPSLFVVWPEGTQHWSLPGLFGGANGRLWKGSCQGVLPRTSATSVLVPCWATAAPHLFRRPSNTSRFGFLWGHCSFPWVLACTLFCVCPPSVESLFPPVLLKSCNQIPLAFKVWFSRNSSSHCQTPRLGSLTCGSEPSLQLLDFCGISVLQFVSHSPVSYWIWFYCDSAPPTVSLRLLLCLCMWVSFWWVPVSSCWWLFSS